MDNVEDILDLIQRLQINLGKMENSLKEGKIAQAAYDGEFIKVAESLLTSSIRRLFAKEYGYSNSPLGSEMLGYIMYECSKDEIVNPLGDKLNYCYVRVIDPDDTIVSDGEDILTCWCTGEGSCDNWETSVYRILGVSKADYAPKRGSVIVMIMMARSGEDVVNILSDKFGLVGSGYITSIKFFENGYDSVMEMLSNGDRYKINDQQRELLENSRKRFNT